jgi:Arc/MetJ-type ribon-helix-helix transcriptional regulator
MSKLKVVSTRVTEPLAKVIEEYLRIDAHVSPADFIRDAIREKIKRDAPYLYKKMLSMETGAPRGELEEKLNEGTTQ